MPTAALSRLHDAVLAGSLSAVAAALTAGEDVNAPNPTTGWSALHYASQTGRADLVEALIDSGADLEARGRFGDTPLFVAVLAWPKVGTTEAVEVLLASGANPHASNCRDHTPMDVARLVRGFPVDVFAAPLA